MNGTTKKAKNLAQQIAKQVTREPWEILKEARKQTIDNKPLPNQSFFPPEATSPQTEKLDQKEKQFTFRQVEALNRELADIARDKLLKSLQEKIARGETVYLEEYSDLSAEQKQVLQAQIEAVKIKEAQQVAAEKPLMEPIPKKSRRLFGFGVKTQAERQKTRVERPLPPSG